MYIIYNNNIVWKRHRDDGNSVFLFTVNQSTSYPGMTIYDLASFIKNISILFQEDMANNNMPLENW